MPFGIAQYRAGDDAAAAESLRALIGNGIREISVTSAFYLAMSLSRQGKDAEARRVATEAIAKMRPLPLDEDNPPWPATPATTTSSSGWPARRPKPSSSSTPIPTPRQDS
jgi:hypothetical protein